MQKVYVFEVHPEATKDQIREALKQLFGVNVTERPHHADAPERRSPVAGRAASPRAGRRPSSRLRDGETLAVFEG